MGCPGCVLGIGISGLVSQKFGIQPPKTYRGRIVSYVLTALSLTITFIALKKMNFSFCKNANSLLGKIASVIVPGIFLGILYSLPINALITKFPILDNYSSNQPEKKSSCNGTGNGTGNGTDKCEDKKD